MPPAFVTPEDEETKRTLLLDLQALIMQGMQPKKSYSMEDRTEDIMLEIRRLTLAMDEASNVGMMRDGLRLFVTGIETMTAASGFSTSKAGLRMLPRHEQARSQLESNLSSVVEAEHIFVA